MATGTVPPPPELLLQVEQEIAQLILANAQVLAKRCAEACVHQVWAAASSQAAARASLDLLHAQAAEESPPASPAGATPVEVPAERSQAAETDNAVPAVPAEASAASQASLDADAAAAEQTQAVPDSQAANDLDEDLWGNFLQADADASAKGKSKGKGKGPPLPSNMQAPRSPAPKAASQGLVRRNSGMTELKARVEAEGLRKDREEAKEITDLDLSQIQSDVPCERVMCGRCEQEVPKEHFESHMTAHSSEILPWLYLGGKRNLENDKELTVRTQISHVLNLAQEVNLKEEIRELLREYQAQRGLEFVYKKVGLGDTPDEDILKDMDSILDFLHEARQSSPQHHVLVNCVQGISRSPAVVLAYLMKFEKMSLRDAYHFLRHRRSIADPRKEFLQQLGKLECQLFNLSAPTLSSDLAFAGRHMLNLDDAPIPVPQKDVKDPQMKHELEALQKVLQNLTSAVQNIGAEAEAAADAVRAVGKEAGVMADDSIATAVQRYASNREKNRMEVPGLNSEKQACEALVDYMRHAAALMLEKRDHFRRQAEEDPPGPQGPAPVRPIV